MAAASAGAGVAVPTHADIDRMLREAIDGLESNGSYLGRVVDTAFADLH